MRIFEEFSKAWTKLLNSWFLVLIIAFLVFYFIFKYVSVD